MADRPQKSPSVLTHEPLRRVLSVPVASEARLDVQSPKTRTFFHITVRYNGETWFVKRRHRDVVELHQNLKRENPSLKALHSIRVPEKSSVGQRKWARKRDNYVEATRHKIEQYFQEISKIVALDESRLLNQFLGHERAARSGSFVTDTLGVDPTHPPSPDSPASVLRNKVTSPDNRRAGRVFEVPFLIDGSDTEADSPDSTSSASTPLASPARRRTEVQSSHVRHNSGSSAYGSGLGRTDLPLSRGKTIVLQCKPSGAPVSEHTRARIDLMKDQMRDHYSRLSECYNSKLRREHAFKRRLEQCASDADRDSATRRHREEEQRIMRERRHKPKLKDYRLITVLGCGGFGKVYLARERHTEALVALKMLSKSVIRERNKVAAIHTERAVLKETKEGVGAAASARDWLVQLYSSFQDESYLFLAMEYAPGGDLKTLLENVGFSESEVRQYCAEMVAAVETLHSMGFVHRDLKPDNFLLDAKGHLKLADFGLSRGGIVSKAPAVTLIRIYLSSGEFKTLALRATDCAIDVIQLMLRKLNIEDAKCEHQLFVTTAGQREHAMLPSDKPLSFLDPELLKQQANGSNPDLSELVRFSFKKPVQSRENSFSRSSKRLSVFQRRTQHRQTLTAQSLAAMRAQHRNTIIMTPGRSSMVTPKTFSFVGSPYYMAPEIIRKTGHDHLVDWWSVGCMIYEMLLGFPPFMGDTPQDVFNSILDHDENLAFPEDEELSHEADGEAMPPLSADFTDFVSKLLREPQQRLGSAGVLEIKAHPFLAATDWANVRSCTPPFVPQLDCETDTSYFGVEIEQQAAVLRADQELVAEERLRMLALDSVDETVDINSRRPHDQVVSPARIKHQHRRDDSGDFLGFTYKPQRFPSDLVPK